MKKIKFDLQFIDEGYGITYFSQSIIIDGKKVEFIVEDLKKSNAELANELITKAWDFTCRNFEDIKTYLAQGLYSSFNKMRLEGKKYVPSENSDAIRQLLTGIKRITADRNEFGITFPIPFNGYTYDAYIYVNKNFKYKNTDILTMGGFKAPKNQLRPDLKNATDLYDYHIKHGDEKGLYKHYAALSAKEINAFIDLFTADKKKADDRINLALYLALYSYSCGEKLPIKLYDYLLKNEIYYYGEIYLRADEFVTNKLIAALEKDDGSKANHLLCAISAISCEASKNFLLQSSREPLPKWAKKLHILPIQYSHVSHWCVDENENITKLYSDEITAFEQCKKNQASPLSPLEPLGEICAYCHQPLTLVFNGKIKLATCLYCSCYENIFVKQDGDKVRWHKKNEPYDFLKKNPKYMKNDEEITKSFEFGIKPTKEKRKPTYTAHEFAEITRTQIGGMPTAINDVNYPKCPDCGKTMKFAAQLDMEDLEEEGIYYFFTCEKCGVHAANHDQP